MLQFVDKSIKKALEPFIKRSHVAIWNWLQRLAPLCDRFDVDRKLVRTIFVDETMIKVKGKQAWVWVAYEPGLRAFLAFLPHLVQPIDP